MGIYTKIYGFIMKRVSPYRYAVKIGVNMGENCKLMGSPNWGSEPWLITIGNQTEISFDCAFITHDGATWCFRHEDRYKDVVKFGKITVGNRCFIGARSTILPGVTIGDRSIIAACSFVNKSVPAGEVWGGVPARFLMTTAEYAEKCLKNTPQYDVNNYRTNFKEEVLKMLSSCERIQ